MSSAVSPSPQRPFPRSMTNSWPRFASHLHPITRAVAGTIGTAAPLRDDAFEAVLSNRGEKFHGRNVEGLGMTNRIPELRNQFAKQRAPLFERPGSQIGAGQNEQVKSIEQDRMPGAAVLQKVEGRHAILVHRRYLAVDNGFVGKTIQGARDGRESLAEITPVARCEMRAAIALDSDAAVAVELELQLPLRTLGHFGDREA